MEDTVTLAISAIQHYAYCPRQFALIHLEQAWADNRFTAEGQLLHQRVDGGEPEQRGNIRYERAVLLSSQRLGIHGKMDLLEIDRSQQPAQFIPVEYKRGKAKTQDWDRLQLCAQALCLEEMRDISVTEGALWYWETRRREVVAFDVLLRVQTERAIESAKAILTSTQTPRPTEHKRRCKACSLIEQCQPDLARQDRSMDYLQVLFKDESA